MQGIFGLLSVLARADSRRSEHRFDATDFHFLGCIRESQSPVTKFIFKSITGLWYLKIHLLIQDVFGLDTKLNLQGITLSV